MYYYLLNNLDVDKFFFVLIEKKLLYMVNVLNFKMSSLQYCINKISKVILMKYKIYIIINLGVVVALQNVKYFCQLKLFLR